MINRAESEPQPEDCVRKIKMQHTKSDTNGGTVAGSLHIFDTHAHLDFPEFDADRIDLLHREPAAGSPSPIEVVGVIIPGIDAVSSQKVLETAALSDRFHAAVAIHPNHTAEMSKDDWHTITALAHQNEVIAIGETGLDRYWDNAPIEVQIDMFHRHIALSQETGKPILIHCRDAWDDLLPILHQAEQLCGVIHAFSGNAEQMQECVELGLFISFAGSVTYRNTKFSALWEAAQKTPADRLLIETDAPFMVPHPFRGKLQRNEPAFAVLTAQPLAELRNVPLQTIAETTTQNAFRLLGKLRINAVNQRRAGQL
jgi:TatD DNase family protein